MILEDKLSESAPYMRVARRRGNKVRLQNVSTGRMGRWITDPYATEQEPAEREEPQMILEDKHARRAAIVDALYHDGDLTPDGRIRRARAYRGDHCTHDSDQICGDCGLETWTVDAARALSLTELNRMRVKDLRSWAERHYGETFKSKARKAEMVGAILALQMGRAK